MSTTEITRNNDIPEYVLGFAFDSSFSRVPLILKLKPAWQAGSLNGIGGCREIGESPLEAMIREFGEETSVFREDVAWKYFAIMQGKDWLVHCFTVSNDEVLNAVRTNERELVVMANPNSLPAQVLPNLRWLIPLAANLGDISEPVRIKYL
jgi:8-oxo-dGTP diphosphatase